MNGIVIVIVISFSELLEPHSKTESARAPAYSRALRRIKVFFQKVVLGELCRSDFQTVREDRVGVKVSNCG